MSWHIIAPLLSLISASLAAYLVWKRVQNRRTRLQGHTIDTMMWRPGFRLTEESRQRFMDDTAGTKPPAHTVSEYILYAAVPITILAVMFYKASLTDSQLAAFNVHVGVVYCGFMAWIFSRLNTIYRNHKLVRHEPHRIHVEFVQNPVEIVSYRSQNAKPSRPASGLTSRQVTILLFVFIIAFTAFTWALKILK